ncbi:hypothetical protein ACA910_019680 [Epithemia clementina (nom. ined.)]
MSIASVMVVEWRKVMSFSMAPVEITANNLSIRFWVLCVFVGTIQCALLLPLLSVADGWTATARRTTASSSSFEAADHYTLRQLRTTNVVEYSDCSASYIINNGISRKWASTFRSSRATRRPRAKFYGSALFSYNYHHDFTMSDSEEDLEVESGGDGLVLQSFVTEPPSSSSENYPSEIRNISTKQFGASTNYYREKFLSYHSNICRIRRILQRQEEDKQRFLQQRPDGRQQSSGTLLGVSEALAKVPVNSLVHFLTSEHGDDDHHRYENDRGATKRTGVWPDVPEQEVLSQTLVHGIKLCSSLNDYRLILRLMEAALTFCKRKNQQAINSSHLMFSNTATTGMHSPDDNNYVSTNQTRYDYMLDSAVLSAAVQGLGETSASLAKIRKFWRLTVPQMRIGMGVTGREVRSMLLVLGKRGKPGAAVQFLESIITSHQTLLLSSPVVDSYCFSSILNVLCDSVNEEIQHKSQGEVAPSLGDEEQDADDKSVWISPCWQWNQGIELMERYLLDDDRFSDCWNNHVFSSLLQLNFKAFERFPRQHRCPVMALQVLEVMQELHKSPDVVTCTHVLSCLGNEWEVALQLLQAMQDPDNEYPEPSVYSYAATIACCSRAREYDVAMDLLQQMRSANSSLNVPPNTVVYNTVMQALKGEESSDYRFTQGTGRKRKVARKRIADAIFRLNATFSLVNFMETDNMHHGYCTSPDRITYNTVLSIVARTASLIPSLAWQDFFQAHESLFAYHRTEWTARERLIHTLLDQMEDANIDRDENTYRQAFFSARSLGLVPVVRLVGRMMKDPTVVVTNDLFNMALSVLADSGDVDGIQVLLERMLKANCRPNSQTTTQVIRAIGNSGTASSLPVFLLALSGNNIATQHIFNFHKFHFDVKLFPPLEAEHFSQAISASVMANDLGSARRILVQMKDNNIESSDRALEAIGRSYAFVDAGTALDISSKSKTFTVGSSSESPRVRAENAYGIVRRIRRPSTSILSLTAKSCAAAGLFGHAQELLRIIHGRMLAEAVNRMQANTGGFHFDSISKANKQAMCGLHRSLIRSCAKQGNVTAALSLTEDIQYFSRQMSWRVPQEGTDMGIAWSEVKFHSESLVDAQIERLYNGATSEISKETIGMNVPEWQSLLIAAAKSGHWRLCLTTLQFLRPFVEATHPDNAISAEDLSDFDQEYYTLSHSLTHAIRCMAVRSQYGWILRSMNDWIEWSGRRPPLNAIAAAFRALCRRGREEELRNLLNLCLRPPPSNPQRDGSSYELSIHVNAITNLHNAGLYNAADEVFVDSVSRGALPFNLLKQAYGKERGFTLDLHGMNVAVAKSAVRVALQHEVLSSSYDTNDVWDNDVVIVTGRGRNSVLQMRPVLRPEVQHMLVEEFYPPLSTTSVPGNMGALRVPAGDIAEWLRHQRQQKDARLLGVAAALKCLTSGHSIRAAVARVATRRDLTEFGNATAES